MIGVMVAPLFFGKQPRHFASHSMIRLARFQGTTPSNFIDRQDLATTLPEMIDEAERFVLRNTRVAAKVTGFERLEGLVRTGWVRQVVRGRSSGYQASSPDR